MVKHHRKTRTRKHSRRGGGYGFGGSILSDAGGANAGNVQWNPDTSQDCGIDAYRGGNGAFAGGVRNDLTKEQQEKNRMYAKNFEIMGNNYVKQSRSKHNDDDKIADLNNAIRLKVKAIGSYEGVHGSEAKITKLEQEIEEHKSEIKRIRNGDTEDPEDPENVEGGRRKRRSTKTKKSKKSKRHTRRRRGGAVSNESLAGRGGNNTMAGGSYAPVSSGESRATQLNPALIQSAPRTGYTFNGSGVAGTADTVRLNG